MKLSVVAASWVAGVAIALYGDIPIAAIGLFLVATGSLTLLFWRHRWHLLFPIAISFALLGALRVELAAPPSVGVQPWLGVPDLTVEGLVVEDPELRDNAVRFRFRTRRVDPGSGWRDAPGDILVTARPSSDLLQERRAPYIRYGDLLVLRGSLQEPPDDLEWFDYQEYLARQVLHALMFLPEVTLVEERQGSPVLALVYTVRGSLARSLAASLPESQASLAQALLLGMRGGVPAEVTQAFRDTGTSHLLAISGLHVGVVLAMSLPLGAALLGRKRNLYLLLPLGLL